MISKGQYEVFISVSPFGDCDFKNDIEEWYGLIEVLAECGKKKIHHQNMQYFTEYTLTKLIKKICNLFSSGYIQCQKY